VLRGGRGPERLPAGPNLGNVKAKRFGYVRFPTNGMILKFNRFHPADDVSAGNRYRCKA
jgi:hypothetical protein